MDIQVDGWKNRHVDRQIGVKATSQASRQSGIQTDRQTVLLNC
jgi:hypothetical protein